MLNILVYEYILFYLCKYHTYMGHFLNSYKSQLCVCVFVDQLNHTQNKWKRDRLIKAPEKQLITIQEASFQTSSTKKKTSLLLLFWISSSNRIIFKKIFHDSRLMAVYFILSEKKGLFFSRGLPLAWSSQWPVDLCGVIGGLGFGIVGLNSYFLNQKF